VYILLEVACACMAQALTVNFPLAEEVGPGWSGTCPPLAVRIVLATGLALSRTLLCGQILRQLLLLSLVITPALIGAQA